MPLHTALFIDNSPAPPSTRFRCSAVLGARAAAARPADRAQQARGARRDGACGLDQRLRRDFAPPAMAKKKDPTRPPESRPPQGALSLRDRRELRGGDRAHRHRGKVAPRRQGVTIAESYADPRHNEIWLINANIPEYLQANRFNHEPKRPRKLLLPPKANQQADRRGRARGHDDRAAIALFQPARPGEDRARASRAARSCTTSARARRNVIGTGKRRG